MDDKTPKRLATQNNTVKTCEIGIKGLNLHPHLKINCYVRNCRDSRATI